MKLKREKFTTQSEAPMGFGEVGRRALYFQGAWE